MFECLHQRQCKLQFKKKSLILWFKEASKQGKKDKHCLKTNGHNCSHNQGVLIETKILWFLNLKIRKNSFNQFWLCDTCSLSCVYWETFQCFINYFFI
jgi:hypothetical protein